MTKRATKDDASSGIYFVRRKPQIVKSKKKLAEELAQPISMKPARLRRPKITVVGEDRTPSGKIGKILPTDSIAVIRPKKTYAPLRPIKVGPEGLPTVEEIMANPQLLSQAPESVQDMLRAKLAGRTRELGQIRQAQLSQPYQLAAIGRAQEATRAEQQQTRLEARANAEDAITHLQNLHGAIQNISPELAQNLVPRLEHIQQTIAQTQQPASAQGPAQAPVAPTADLLQYSGLFTNVDDPTQDELRLLTKTVLLQYAKSRGIRNYSGLNKEQLVAHIRNSRAMGREPGQEFGLGLKKTGGSFALPTGTNPTGTPTGGALLGAGGKGVQKHVAEVMAGVNLPQHFKKFVSLARKAEAGGALSGTDMKKLDDYRKLNGGGFFDSLWSGIKSVGSTALGAAKSLLPMAMPLITPMLAPMLGPAAPFVGAILPKLLGGAFVGRRPKHVKEVMAGINLPKHFKKFVSLARKAEAGGALSAKESKKFEDYRKLNGGGFFDKLWSGIKSVGSTVASNLPAIIENAPKAIEYGKKAYDFGKTFMGKKGGSLPEQGGGFIGNLLGSIF